MQHKIQIVTLCAALLGVTACNPQEVNVPSTYLKLDASGQPLVDQAVAWDDSETASEAQFNRWSCVQDETSQLIWEVKSSFDEMPTTLPNPDGSEPDPYVTDDLHGANNLYTWYNTDSATNGGEHGVGDLGQRLATDFENGPYNDGPAADTPEWGSDACLDVSRCDTEKFIADVNAKALCGGTNWRLPTQDELAFLVYGFTQAGGVVVPTIPAGEAHINPDYFPNISPVTTNPSFLSSTTHDSQPELAGAVNFKSGRRGWVGKGSLYHVMLVREP